MFDFNKGSKETYYEVAAYEKTENLFATIKQCDKYKDAKFFCEEHEYKYKYLYKDKVIKFNLIIIKVTSEIL